MQALEQKELLRYSRHFPVIGVEGQQQLKNAKVLCVGGGGLGCPALQYLAACGVGTLGIVDGDVIELSNLQRQILFTEGDVGRNKAVVIGEKLKALNSHIDVRIFSEFLSATNAQAIISNFDIIIDASDNYPARYLLNQMCRSLAKPLVSASIYHYEAQLSVFNYKQGPCYQCLYPEPPPAELSPNCAVSGVLGVLPGVAGSLQAMEVIKIIIDSEQVLSGTLLSFNLLDMHFKHFDIPAQDCNTHPNVQCNVKSSCVTSSVTEMTATELAQLISTDPDAVHLLDVREAYERELCHIGGTHIPLSHLNKETMLAALTTEKPIVVYCKSGGRSATACQKIKDFGVYEVRNLRGGIISWIQTIDSSLTIY